MGKAPTSVMVVSILGIIFAALGILATPVSVYLTVHPLAANPVADAMAKDPFYVRMLLISSVVGMLMSIWLLVASIGGLRVKRWGRLAMNAYSVVQIVWTLAGTIFTVAYVIPTMAKASEGQPEAFRQGTLIGSVVGAGVGFLFAIGIVTVLLVVFNRKVAVDAFNGIFPEANTSDQPTGGVV